MSGFNVYFSDPKKAGTPIVVEDGTKNTGDTSVTLIGRNAAGYAQSVATNFVHLLENHASDSPPNNPIEGQLWYDNDNHRLKINDSTAGGANWKPVSGVYQQTSEPSTALPGDVWVDTGRAQLYITVDGINWTLVGPSYSSTLKSGSYPEVIKDKFGIDRTIIKQYVNGNVVEIISQEAFVPQQIIEGFDNIQSGINLNTSFSSKLNSTAYAAERILVTQPYTDYVLGNNFLRTDIDGTIKAQLTVRDGVTIGSDPAFTLYKDSYRSAVIANNYIEGKIVFKINNIDSVSQDIVTLFGDTRSMGINIGSDSPATINGKAASLDVRGDTYLSGSLVGSTATFTGPTTLTNSLKVMGPSEFRSVATLTSIVYIGSRGNSSSVVGTTAIVPLSGSYYNIGSSTAKFSNVYSENFWGQFNGNVTGSASYLNTASSWSILGHLRGDLNSGFRGDAGRYTFDTRLDVTAITSQTEVTSVDPTASVQHILVATANTGTVLSKVSKANFLADLYTNLVPAGAILPYGGLTAPDGWLLCDGSVVDRAYYPELYSAIGKVYGGTSISSQFKLPDLRGRMAIGYDDMNNGFGSSPTSAAGRVPGANRPDSNLSIQGNAPLVVGGSNTATITAGSSGPLGVTTSTNQISSVMNPYSAFNYIIKT